MRLASLSLWIACLFAFPIFAQSVCRIDRRDEEYAEQMRIQSQKTEEILKRSRQNVNGKYYSTYLYEEVVGNKAFNINPASLRLEKKDGYDSEGNDRWVSVPPKQQNFTDFENTITDMDHHDFTNGDLLKDLETPGPEITSGPPKKYLEMSEAIDLLNSGANKCIPTYAGNDGVCFLKATHIAKQIADKYPEVPVLKFWLVGNMGTENGQKWYYHVVPIVPVRQGGNVAWMALDVLTRSSGPSHVRSWANYWYHKAVEHETDFLLKVSLTNKLSPLCKTLTPELFQENKGSEFQKNLQKLHKID